MAGRDTPHENDAYRRHKERAAKKQAGQSRSGRDIGELPPIGDIARHASSRDSLRLFCDTYLAAWFKIPWSDDHLEAIRRMESAAIRGDLFALAMPRGSGKTTLSVAACLWAMCHGHRRFIALIGADSVHAETLLAILTDELVTNDLLATDFPAACLPLRALEGIANRCAGQLCRGEPTHIRASKKELCLATIAGAASSGCLVKARGITGRIRGMSAKAADGSLIRPDLAIVDDPQTDVSAASPRQVTKRIGVLNGAILGLSGPGCAMAAVMPVTVIVPGDMADQILDHDKYPQWHGLRTKLLYALPTRMDLWDDYARLRAEEMRAGRDETAANAYYLAHRAEMDAGAQPAWIHRRNPGELSAIQHAMHLRADRGIDAFAAEYQNDPQRAASELQQPTPSAIAAKASGLPRGIVPHESAYLTAYIDVHLNVLYYAVCAFTPKFGGHVVDYGTWPDQRRSYFVLSDARYTLTGLYPGDEMTAIWTGLEALTTQLFATEYARDGGGVQRLQRLLVDANWGESTDTVYNWCRMSRYATVVMPAHGKGITENSKPMSEWNTADGEIAGDHWRIPLVGKKRIVRHALIDTNHWKTFLHAGWETRQGNPRAMTLFGDQAQHQLFSEHQCAERRYRRRGRNNRVLTCWEFPPNGFDNHWLDCMTGCCVCASMLGAVPPQGGDGQTAPRPPRRPSGPRRSRPLN